MHIMDWTQNVWTEEAPHGYTQYHSSLVSSLYVSYDNDARGNQLLW